MNNDLILGMAMNYNWGTLKNFICSLRQTDYAGEVILFVSPDLDAETRAALTRQSIQYIELEANSHYFRGLPEWTNSDPEMLSRLPPSVHRIWVFYNFLLENKDKYRHILLTDVRDVIFQRDPFVFDFQDKLCFFIESREAMLKDSDWDAIWIIAAFGVQALYEMGDSLVSNVGTIIGPVAKVVDYLRRLLTYLHDIRVHMVFGIEQGVHNYALVNKAVDDFLLFYTEDGPVATLSKIKDIRQDENGYLLNFNNEIAHVVHQYDRHPSLKSYFDVKYN
nr:hypothetical protein [uncultured Chitinophaga sp.]